jgi:hypothetical protein
MMRLLHLPIVLILSITIFISTWSCGKPSAKEETKPPQHAVDVKNNEEASCRAFVQEFYDWYWNQFADKGGDPRSRDDVLKRRPSLLSPELTRLIKKEEDEMSATGQIGNLDFDPFLNSQDMSGKFLVTSVQISNGVCRATVKGSSEVRPELQKSGSTWIFVNFHYSFYSEDGKTKRFPDDDLIHILKR